jgi:hypothetical protein
MISDINTGLHQLALSATANPCWLRPLSVATLFCKVILLFSANFRVKIKISQIMANSAARLKIPRPGKTVGSIGYQHET